MTKIVQILKSVGSVYLLNNPNRKERSSELKLRLISIEREATQRKLKSIRNYADELEDELTGMKRG